MRNAWKTVLFQHVKLVQNRAVFIHRVKSAAKIIRLAYIVAQELSDTIPSMKDKKMTQKERFEQAAKELGVDLDETKLAETLRRIAKPEPEKKKPADE